MIQNKKILFFSDFNLYRSKQYMKTASSMRISYFLRKHNHDVKQIFHLFSFTKDELKNIIKQYNPDIVCISTSFLSYLNNRYYVSNDTNKTNGYHWGNVENFEKIMLICQESKKLNSTVIIGGWEVNLKNLTCIDKQKYGYEYLSQHVDFFVIGDGSSVLLDIINNDKISYYTISNMKITNGANVLDFTDNASTPIVNDIIFPKESLITELASGCIFSCSFCNYASLGKKKNEFVRSYDSLKKEIITNYENFGTYFYMFTDNIINDYSEKLKMLIEIKEETGIDIRWTSYARLDTIKDMNDVMLLKDSGAASLIFGIESLNKKVGSNIGKLTDKNKLVEKLHMCRDVFKDNVLMTGLFINGLPTETLDSCEDTFNFLSSNEGKYLLDSYSFSTLVIFEENNMKNEINKKRNNPFRDYVIEGNTWTSPWGNRLEFFKKSKEFLKKTTVENFITGFSLNSVHNSGIEIANAVKIHRHIIKHNDVSLNNKLRKTYLLKTDSMINKYKKELLSSI